MPYAHQPAPSYHMCSPGTEFCNIIPLLGSCYRLFFPHYPSLSHHISKAQCYLSFTHVLLQTVSGNKKFTSQQSTILSASTQKEIWYTALGFLNNLAFNAFLCELFQHFTHDKLCGCCLPYLKQRAQQNYN